MTPFPGNTIMSVPRLSVSIFVVTVLTYYLLFRSSSYSPVSSWTLEGLFELTQRPSWALNLEAYLASKLQRYKDSVRCAALGAEVPRRRQPQLM